MMAWFVIQHHLTIIGYGDGVWALWQLPQRVIHSKNYWLLAASMYYTVNKDATQLFMLVIGCGEE
jgi:hypothetical protein